MLNEEKVILMTQMASYEENEGKENMKIYRYFRSDYIAVQILKSVFSVTVAYALLLALYVFYNLEFFMQDIYTMDLVGFAKNVVLYYVIVSAIYVVMTYIICTCRYVGARKSLRIYYKNLKKLNSMYHES